MLFTAFRSRPSITVRLPEEFESVWTDGWIDPDEFLDCFTQGLEDGALVLDEEQLFALAEATVRAIALLPIPTTLTRLELFTGFTRGAHDAEFPDIDIAIEYFYKFADDALLTGTVGIHASHWRLLRTARRKGAATTVALALLLVAISLSPIGELLRSHVASRRPLPEVDFPSLGDQDKQDEREAENTMPPHGNIPPTTA